MLLSATTRPRTSWAGVVVHHYMTSRLIGRCCCPPLHDLTRYWLVLLLTAIWPQTSLAGAVVHRYMTSHVTGWCCCPPLHDLTRYRLVLLSTAIWPHTLSAGVVVHRYMTSHVIGWCCCPPLYDLTRHWLVLLSTATWPHTSLAGAVVHRYMTSHVIGWCCCPPPHDLTRYRLVLLSTTTWPQTLSAGAVVHHHMTSDVIGWCCCPPLLDLTRCAVVHSYIIFRCCYPLSDLTLYCPRFSTWPHRRSANDAVNFPSTHVMSVVSQWLPIHISTCSEFNTDSQPKNALFCISADVSWEGRKILNIVFVSWNTSVVEWADLLSAVYGHFVELLRVVKPGHEAGIKGEPVTEADSRDRPKGRFTTNAQWHGAIQISVVYYYYY